MNVEKVVNAALAEIDDDFRRLNSARAWAVHHEQAATEYGRRVRIALAYLEELPCFCDQSPEGALLQCPRHDLEDILNGDVA